MKGKQIYTDLCTLAAEEQVIESTITNGGNTLWFLC